MKSTPTRSSNDGMDETDWERKRQQILVAAGEVFARRGFPRGTTKEIANLAGLSQPSIYHYVGAKDDLLREIALEVAKSMNAAIDRALASSKDPVEQLRCIINEFTLAVLENQTTFGVYWKEHSWLDPEVEASVTADERRFVAAVTNVVKAAQKEEAIPSDRPPLVLAEGLLGMCCWAYRWYRPAGPNTPEEIAASFRALVGL